MSDKTTGLYGHRQGVGIDQPVTSMYWLGSSSGGVVARRHLFGAWLPVVDDKTIGADGEVLPVHVRQLVKSGQLSEFDESWRHPAYHHVEQFAVAIEKVDIPGMLDEGKTPSLFIGAYVSHSMTDDGFTYYTAERGLLYPGGSVRSPVVFSMNLKNAALKKYGTIVEAWDAEEEFEVARFVRRREEPWELEPYNVQDSTLWKIVMSYLQDKEKVRLDEIKRLENRPLEELDGDTFAKLFQQKMARGGS